MGLDCNYYLESIRDCRIEWPKNHVSSFSDYIHNFLNIGNRTVIVIDELKKDGRIFVQAKDEKSNYYLNTAVKIIIHVSLSLLALPPTQRLSTYPIRMLSREFFLVFIISNICITFVMQILDSYRHDDKVYSSRAYDLINAKKVLEEGINLTPQMITKVIEIWEKVIKCGSDFKEMQKFSGVNWLSRSVFALSEYPDYIFKHCDTIDRFVNTLMAQAICSEKKFDCLLVPQVKQFGGGSFVIEKKLDIDVENQEFFYQEYADRLDKAVSQLRDFILLSGDSDVEWRNYPIYGDPQKESVLKITLLDHELREGKDIGILGWDKCRRTGLIRLLSERHAQEVADYVVNGEGFDKTVVHKVLQQRIDELVEYKKLINFYKTNQIIKTNQQINLPILTSDMRSFFVSSCYQMVVYSLLQYWVRGINEHLLSLSDKVKYYPKNGRNLSFSVRSGTFKLLDCPCHPSSSIPKERDTEIFDFGLKKPNSKDCFNDVVSFWSFSHPTSVELRARNEARKILSSSAFIVAREKTKIIVEKALAELVGQNLIFSYTFKMKELDVYMTNTDELNDLLKRKENRLGVEIHLQL